MTNRENKVLKILLEDIKGIDGERASEIIENLNNAVDCDHICTSRCGNDTECNCDCGDMHID